MLIAIDPGTEESAILVETEAGFTLKEIMQNEEILEQLEYLGSLGSSVLLIEMVASYGMPVGREIFETCVWIGRFYQAFCSRNMNKVEFIYRKNVKMELCGSFRAKDSNVRQALLDLYPATGGGKTPQVGTAKNPGPLFGIKSHLWSALAVLKYYELSGHK